MPCPNKDHHINCQCHKGGPVEPLYVDDEYIAFYFNMLAGIPEYDKLQQELNDTIIECGGLEEACSNSTLLVPLVFILTSNHVAVVTIKL